MKKSQLIFTLIILQCVCSLIDLSAQSNKESSNYSNSVITRKNIRYAEKPAYAVKDTSSDRLLDLYLPKEKIKKKLPVLIYIHGGGFISGDKNDRYLFCSKLASEGIAVISINYRLYLKHNKTKGASCGANMSKGLPTSGEFNVGLQEAIKTAGEDASLALLWLKRYAKKYNFDTKKIIMSGGSAGAITALYVGLCTKTSLKLGGVINMWGGVENNNKIINKNIPVLTFHGDKDNTISVDYAYSLHEFLDTNGNKLSKNIIINGAGHGGSVFKEVWNNKMDTIVSFIKD